MKRIICKKEYDTQTATLIGRKVSGAFGDPSGYEELLYQTVDGFYFLYGVGGAASPYPVETIKRLSRSAAGAWIEENK